MANATAAAALPPLPPYTLQPQLPLIPGLPDKYASLLLPVLAYWALSLFFHWIDVNDFFPQYRLHTPTEISQRNRVSRWEVFRDVVLQQMIQTATGVLIGYFEPDAYEGKEQHDVAVWAQRIRLAQSAVPALLSLLGVNAAQLAGRLSGPAPMLAGLIAGGSYPTLVETLAGSGVDKVIVPAFARWEVVVAGSIYWALMPALKFLCAVLFVDTWQYFWHRGMHLNKWLYGELCIHPSQILFRG